MDILEKDKSKSSCVLLSGMQTVISFSLNYKKFQRRTDISCILR